MSRPIPAWPRAGAIAFALIAMTAISAPAFAETPVDQCADSGSPPSAPAPSGTGFQPEPNLARATASSAAPNLGSVDRRSGAFTYSGEDLALGTGEFPARLNLVRTYNSIHDGPNGEEVVPDAPWSAGSIKWYALGRGATHNLDIRFQENEQSLGGQRYVIVEIRMGFAVEAFQRCLDGQYVNTRQNGSRLFADATYSAGGYRYEGRDGTVLLFEKTPSSGSVFSCERVWSWSRVCGVARRWSAPNGDWAEFEYETYYSHPSNRAETTLSGGTITHWVYNSTIQECYPNFAGQSECHGVMYPNYYTTTAQFYPEVLAYPVMDRRLTRVHNSRGYELRFQYVDPGTGGSPTSYPAVNYYLQRNRLASVSGHWVSPTGQSTNFGQVAYGYSSCWGTNPDCLSSIQAVDGATTLINRTGYSLAIQLPGETSASTTVTFVNAPLYHYYPDRPRGYYTTLPRLPRYYLRVSNQAFADATSVQYAPTFADRWVAEPHGMWARMPYVASMRITEPGSAVTTLDYVDQYDEHGGPVSITDPLNRVTEHSYNGVGALVSTTAPEGQRTDFNYDVRGNLLSTIRYPKVIAGSTLDEITESQTYHGGPTATANACANQRLCNRPTSRTDARGFRTDYVWDSATGLLVSETRPADAAGLRPTVTYGYASFTGADSSPITLPVSRTERIDASANAVAGYGYAANIRLAPREQTRSAGGTILRSCYRFDTIGNLISETEPNAALASCP